MSKNKKTLLNETQVRQFMKLAMLQPLANGFINEMNCGDEEGPYEEESQSLVMEEEEEMLPHADEDPLNGSDVELVDDEPAEEEPELEAPVDADSGAKMIPIQPFLDSLAATLERYIDLPVEIDAEPELLEPEEEEPEEEEPEEEEPEADLEMGAEEDELAEGGPRGGRVEDDPEALLAWEKKHGRQHPSRTTANQDRRTTARARNSRINSTYKSIREEDDLLESVTKRVAARILKAALKNK